MDKPIAHAVIRGEVIASDLIEYPGRGDILDYLEELGERLDINTNEHMQRSRVLALVRGTHHSLTTPIELPILRNSWKNNCIVSCT